METKFYLAMLFNLIFFIPSSYGAIMNSVIGKLFVNEANIAYLAAFSSIDAPV